ncbi:hypothetical protein TVAG_403610 [Trichomonas vaginalis G3]|uniref:Uncharacterized protein n=1 Tax=Trichomonas vaginalis (strain ATCC PRA-98 / G3) TaxID=412133 RepID=A2ELN9_TRIV3|nr:hypothetical protein TVAGG3_0894880 [Trichomonas vaginalis G3]EAY06404.1 hypothetical protein TVAG_403610 [Trichomonas vaginalis G3]KAI5502992.1 hypothetical protein TVAGG3_0894880 [Trichomonas vaginalis G3]|eukprot:XP_001318627.1 hypothetical protein [Trichomonas vaginalis G3]
MSSGDLVSELPHNMQKEFEYDRHSYTPQPRRTAKIFDDDEVSQKLSYIEEKASLIEEISQKNTQAHSKCMKLQYELSSITKTLDKNVDFILNACKTQEAANEKLSNEINNLEKYHGRLQFLIDACANHGIDVREIPGLDQDKLSQYFDIPLPIAKGEILDPTIKFLISKYQIFSRCKTNQDFVRKCYAIKEEVEKPEEARWNHLQEKDPAERIFFLKKYLRELRQSNATITARMSKELKVLTDERDDLLHQIAQLQQKRRSKKK